MDSSQGGCAAFHESDSYPQVPAQFTHTKSRCFVMSNEREINAIAKDPDRARNIAKLLLTLPNTDWSDWELDFLEGMSACVDELSYRQAEKLVELRNEAVRHTHGGGFRFSSILEICWQNRTDLDSEDDVEFLERLKSRGETALRRRDAFHLRRCAIELGQIEPYQSWSMPYATL
jgi:hypothetical protein